MILAALTVGSLLSLATRGSRNSPFASAASLVVTPLQGISAAASRAFRNFGNYFRSSAALQKQLAERNKEIESLRARLVDYDKAKKEVAFYEKFLEIKEEQKDLQLAPANIIGTDAADYFRTCTLNRGSSAGIRVKDPVILGKYLVGVVTKTSRNSCTVQTILNPNARVAIYDTTSGALGVTDNTIDWANDGYCIVPQLNTFIDTGDLLCTSGKGGIYPRDLILGTVKEILTEPVSVTAVVTPAVDFKNLSDVAVLLRQSKETEP